MNDTEKGKIEPSESCSDCSMPLTPAPTYASLQSTTSVSNLPNVAELPGNSTTFENSLRDNGHTRDDGRVDIDCDSKLVRSLSRLYPTPRRETPESLPPEYQPKAPKATLWTTKLNIVVQVVGSRGDVQPFVALGTQLQKFGHRVRLATHDVFEMFVRDAGLEFYPIGGNPAELMAYMVRNPDLIPSMKSLAAGEIQRKRDMVEGMLEKFWDSCLQSDPHTGSPFVADAIIANPPSFAHIHCAQALGVPVHLMFTMPWSSTRSFPHPLANLKNVGSEPGIANHISYSVVEWMMWQGLGSLINKWRRSIDLEEVALFDGPALTQTLKIPFTYCWSPALVPKPTDWPSHIDVCGFFFRDAPRFSPPPDLAEFLAYGPPPIYVGFGSIVLEDPERIVNIVLDAVRATGTRAIISKGWSKLAGSKDDRVYWIEECPHEWLFQHVAAVVHHGGAGTTACGLRNGKPTMIVPFFGDQPFWGEMVAKAGAGPSPIPHTEMSVKVLAEGIRYCLSQEAVAAASKIAAKMEYEMGARAAVQSFHRQLSLERIQCDLIPEEAAVWMYKKSKRPLKLSKIAAEIILANTSTELKQIGIYQTNPITIDTTRWDPISGGASAVMATATDLTGSVTGVFTKPVETWRDDRRRRARDMKRAASANSSLVTHHDIEKVGTNSACVEARTSAQPAQVKGTKNKTQGSLAGRMAGASAMSIGNFAPTALKGMMVDIPLALTEGMRSVPQYYGGSTRDNGSVTDFRSGAAVAGKTFAWGFIDGLSDVVVQPYKGAKEEGALGIVKGLGKGMASLVVGSGAGMFGMLAYPSAGISKSLRLAAYRETRKAIALERHAEGIWMIQTGKAAAVDTDNVVFNFISLQDST